MPMPGVSIKFGPRRTTWCEPSYALQVWLSGCKIDAWLAIESPHQAPELARRTCAILAMGFRAVRHVVPA
jgi:hypothetical protein